MHYNYFKIKYLIANTFYKLIKQTKQFNLLNMQIAQI